MKLRKMLSVALSVLLLLACVPLGAVSVSAATHSHPVCGTNCSCADAHSAKTWQAFPSGTTTLSSGNYYLTSNITFTGENKLRIIGNVSICLNGYSISKHYNSTVVAIESSGTLTLSDCKGTGKIMVTDDGSNVFGGGGTLSIFDSGSLIMYGGTVSCTSFVGAIYCRTTGNLSIYGGAVTGDSEGIDVGQVNDLTISGGTFKSENNVALFMGDVNYSATFHDISISGGYFEGAYCGMSVGSKSTCTGKITISGGEFYGKGPVPNATTWSFWYHGLAFLGADCNLTISGGIFRGARGGFYNSNPDLNVIISGGTFIKGSSSFGCGIEASNGGTYLIEGGTIYGMNCSTYKDYDVRVTVTGGEILYISGSGSFNLKVYGGTIGQIGTTMATNGIVSSSGNVEIYRGTILGNNYAISKSNGSLLVSGGTLSGGTADVYVGTVGTTAEDAVLSLDGYTGSAISVALPTSVSESSYIAKDVSRADLITGLCSIRYDSAQKAIMASRHNYNKTVIPPTCISTGYTQYVCSACGDTYTSNTTAVVAHKYETTVTEPTCGVEGVKTYTCSGCGDSYTESIPATGEHTYSDDCDTICDACGTARNAPHIYTNICDTVCDICGFERSEGAHMTMDGVCTFTNATNYPFAWSESDGYYCSTNKDNSTTATATLTAITAGTITIRYYTSTESNYDKLIIKQNDTTMVTRSGETSWESTTFTVAAGDKIYISYSKDFSFSRNADTVYFQITSGLATEMEPTCEEAVVCLECGAVVQEALGHTYDNACDVDCDLCGAIREAPHDYADRFDDTCDACGRHREDYDILGDANGDGTIDILDEALLAQYNAGWKVTLDEVVADVNGDGTIDILDEALLAQYNAGWGKTWG